MSVQGGEVSGLGGAGQFAAGMSAATAGQTPYTAAFIATLQASGVGGEVLDAARAAQQATEVAGAAWQRAHTELAGHQQVGEAYAANPGAGTKEFVMDAATGGNPQPSADEGPPADPSPPDPDTPAGPASAGPPVEDTPKEAKDPLKVGDRIVLLDGERFAGSARVRDSDGALALVAAVDTPTGRQVHVGLPIDPEERKNWKGGNAPERETRPVEDDEADGETYEVDTWADCTVVLDADDAAKLPEQVDEMIATATEADKEYRQLLKESDRLYDERSRLESQRFPGRGEEKISTDWKVEHEQQTQGRRRRDHEQVAERLDPTDRAVYDERQQKIDAAGKDGWEPGREAAAADVCGLTPEQFAEVTEIERAGDRHRTRAQSDRLDELKYGGGDCLHPILPPLLEQQAALVCGLTPEEYREMERLEAIPARSRYDYYNRGRRVRTDAEQARLDELYDAPGGVTGANQRETYKLRNRYRSGLEHHHSGKWDVAEAKAKQSAMEATAQALDPATTAELQRVTAEYDAVGEKVEARGGWPSATVEVPARNGGALVIEAMQEEETGGVRYRAERKPANADEDWSPGSNMDPYTATAGGMRKLAKTIADAAAG